MEKLVAQDNSYSPETYSMESYTGIRLRGKTDCD
jgi:hypothetical protein